MSGNIVLGRVSVRRVDLHTKQIGVRMPDNEFRGFVNFFGNIEFFFRSIFQNLLNLFRVFTSRTPNFLQSAAQHASHVFYNASGDFRRVIVKLSLIT